MAQFAQVLEYVDGPQAVLLEKPGDRKIVAVAIEYEDYRYPFFGAEISGRQWERYQRGMVDLRYLFMFPRWKSWYLFDLGAVKDGAVKLVPVPKNLAAEDNYIPDPGFFSYDHTEQIKTMPSYRLYTQRYLTDGIWDLPDFTEFYHKITDLYVFYLSLKKYRDPSTPMNQKTGIREAFSEHPLRGGASYVNLYKDLAAVQNMEERLAVGKLEYASPGKVDVRGRRDIFAAMLEPLEGFEENYEELKEQYRYLHAYLQRNKYLSAKAESFDNASKAARFMKRQADKLARGLELDDAELIYELTGRNTLRYTKVVLAHFRRLEGYFMFFAEGRAKAETTSPEG